FNLSLPESAYSSSSFKIDDKEQSLNQSKLNNGEYLHTDAKELSFATASRSIKIKADTLSTITGRPDTGKQNFIRLYFPIAAGLLRNGQVFERTYEIHVTGEIDQSPVTLKL